jgi:mono/diheme cytochrome c family protein
VDESLSHLKPSDIAAMVEYLRSIPSVSSPDLPPPKTQAAPSGIEVAANGDLSGQVAYGGACAGCHGWTGVSPGIGFATLIGTRAVNDPTANNVAQVIIHGGQRHTPTDSNNMPQFGDTYSNEEIASLANFVTARFGAKGSGLTAEQVAKLRSED